MVNSKKQLAIALSKLLVFDKPSIRLEQYPTDSEVAAEVIWWANQYGDIQGKVMADLGCGTGILGIGCMFFDPKEVYFVDTDEKPLKRLKENLILFERKNFEIHNLDVNEFNQEVDVIFQNPPFGVKSEHADKVFLEKAFKISKVIYSFHKTTSENFIKKISSDFRFKITHFFKFNFPLKQTQSYHTRKVHRIDVGCWRMEKS